MDVKKQLCSVAHMVVPAVGFVLTCSGAYLLSLQTEYGCTWRVIVAYIMIVSGFLAVIVGVFWTICHSMRSKLYHRGGHERHIQVYTIERPNFYPPSYEESQGGRMCPGSAPEFAVVFDEVDVTMSLAPPLYSQDSSEAPDCTWSWEQPPRYSQDSSEAPDCTWSWEQPPRYSQDSSEAPDCTWSWEQPPQYSQVERQE